MKSEQPPPTYCTTDPETNAPPTYDSLFGKARAMKEESSGTLDFVKKLVAFFLGSIGCSILLGFILVIPIAMIVIGAKYLDDCPEEKLIPVWLVVSGVLGLARNVMAICCRCFCCKKEEEEGEEGTDSEEQGIGAKLIKAFDSLLSLVMVCWFIAGNVWVYRSKGDISSDSSAVNYCHRTVYWFAFWVLTGGYILMGVAILAGCVCCVCLCCCVGKKAE